MMSGIAVPAPFIAVVSAGAMPLLAGASITDIVVSSMRVRLVSRQNATEPQTSRVDSRHCVGGTRPDRRVREGRHRRVTAASPGRASKRDENRAGAAMAVAGVRFGLREGCWSTRRGTYRLLYRIRRDVREVIILRVEHRRDAHRPLHRASDFAPGGRPWEP
ncbi:MAG TPA: type II toxin-antitoxin system RelE/ParE family toxin [Actinomycetes bacterium]